MDAKVGGDSREGFAAILWRTGGAFFHRGDFRPGAVGSGGGGGMTRKNRAGYLQCTDKWQEMPEEGALSGGGRSHSGMWKSTRSGRWSLIFSQFSGRRMPEEAGFTNWRRAGETRIKSMREYWSASFQ